MFWLENHARFSGVINFLGDMNIRSRVSEHRRGLPDSRVFRRRNLASCSEKQQEPRRNAHPIPPMERFFVTSGAYAREGLKIYHRCEPDLNIWS